MRGNAFILNESPRCDHNRHLGRKSVISVTLYATLRPVKHQKVKLSPIYCKGTVNDTLSVDHYSNTGRHHTRESFPLHKEIDARFKALRGSLDTLITCRQSHSHAPLGSLPIEITGGNQNSQFRERVNQRP